VAQPKIAFYDLEALPAEWILDAGVHPYTTDFGVGIGLPEKSTNSTTWVVHRLCYIDIESLEFAPKLFGLFCGVATRTDNSYYRSYAQFYIAYKDASGATLRADIILDVSTTSTSYVWWKGGYVGMIPSGTKYIEIYVAHRESHTYANSFAMGWVDNIVLAEDGSVAIHATPIFFYNVSASYEIPINVSVPSGSKAVYVRIRTTSPPSGVSITPTLYYDTSTASPSETAVLTVSTSVTKLVYSGSASANVEQRHSVDAYAVLIVKPPNEFVHLIIAWLNTNTSPHKPESISFSIPTPANNYTTSYTATMLLQHSTTTNLFAKVRFTIGIEGDPAGISYAKIAITVKDPSENVVYDDYFEVVDGSVVKEPAELVLQHNTTYSITYTLTVTASPSIQTYINVFIQYTTRPEV